MKHQLIVSTLAALVVFAATTTAQAGIFGRLSTVWHGCNPCEPAACQPCEPIACQPCEVVACDPCEPVCDPCEPMCDPCGTPCAYRPFRPFGGFFARLAGGPVACAVPCGDVACQPCEVVACDPCEPVCEPMCDPCEVVCDPCGAPCGPFLPFNGFFMNLRARLATPCAVGCVPCEPVACDPCEPIACDPCL